MIAFLALSFILVSPSITSASAQSQKVPVIVLFKEKPTGNDVNAINSVGGEITRTYSIIPGFAVNIPQDRIQALKSNPNVLSVDPDVEVRAVDINADRQIRADLVWATPTSDIGQGVPVAILDTGIDTGHPEFSGRIILCHNEIFTKSNTCNDKNGHGTHVAGIVGATGILNEAKGVAPGVSFYVDQVLNAAGSGSLSGIIAGIDWAVANHAKVISMSLGTSPLVTTESNCDGAYPTMTAAVNNAVSAGVTVVAAAGNSGTSGVGAPGCISSTIAVGAVDSSDNIASFSSQGGPLADHGIVAPGVSIYSTIPGGYGTMSGTSMATPVVSGTVALLVQANSSLTPSSLRNILFDSAYASPSWNQPVPNATYGHGRVDAYAAYSAAVGAPAPQPSPDFSISTSSPISVQQGDAGSSTVTVTSFNGFSSAVTLSISGAPAGVTTSFSDNPITPPSGGSVTSALALSVDQSVPAGTYALTVTGESGSVTHSASLSLVVTSVPTGILSVAVSTDKSSYTQNSFALITVTVSANSTPVSGASVTLTIKDPNNGTAQGSGTTDSSGHVTFKYRITPKALTGTYIATANASAPGFNPGSGSVTFTVQ